MPLKCRTEVTVCTVVLDVYTCLSACVCSHYSTEDKPGEIGIVICLAMLILGTFQWCVATSIAVDGMVRASCVCSAPTHLFFSCEGIVLFCEKYCLSRSQSAESLSKCRMFCFLFLLHYLQNSYNSTDMYILPVAPTQSVTACAYRLPTDTQTRVRHHLKAKQITCRLDFSGPHYIIGFLILLLPDALC